MVKIQSKSRSYDQVLIDLASLEQKAEALCSELLSLKIDFYEEHKDKISSEVAEGLGL